jgi:hypothetical protein
VSIAVDERCWWALEPRQKLRFGLPKDDERLGKRLENAKAWVSIQTENRLEIWRQDVVPDEFLNALEGLVHYWSDTMTIQILLMDRDAPSPPLDYLLRLEESKAVDPVVVASRTFERRDLMKHSAVAAAALRLPMDRSGLWEKETKVALDFFHALVAGKWYTTPLSLADLISCTRFAHENECSVMLKECERLLCERVSATTVLAIYDFAKLHDLKKANARCYQFIFDKAKKLILDPLNCRPDLLLLLLQQVESFPITHPDPEPALLALRRKEQPETDDDSRREKKQKVESVTFE